MASNDVIRNKTNTFASGLVMDLSPTTVEATALTNALNATLTTNNGNEGSLQQDMGNGRVETAFLPEGYVPVGTCEFGDIIYVVSYNPLQNKSQIGCFPSPERNVTTEETGGLGQSVDYTEFQGVRTYEEEKVDDEGNPVLDGDGNPETETVRVPNGVVNAMTLKKILYDNQKMNPGDRFVVYVKGAGTLEKNGGQLTDYGNTAHVHGGWPKMVNVRVVSVEDSGRITDLNADVKWYDNDYYLNVEVGGESSSVDIDSYRSLVSSAYSTFRGKVSGRLALMLELEAPDSFSASYEVFTDKRDVYTDADGNPTLDENNNPVKGGEETTYDIWFHTSWGTSNVDVNPMGFIMTGSAWTTDLYGGHVGRYDGEGNPYNYDDEIPEPYGVGTATDEVTGEVTEGYDYGKVLMYARTYKMEDPGGTYEEYTGGKSYNAFIGDILDWNLDPATGTHGAIADEGSYGDLRQVTRVTKLVDADGRYVVEDNGARKVMCWYNLDSIGTDAEGGEEHRTKAAHGADVVLRPVPLNDDVVVNAFASDVPMRLPICNVVGHEGWTIRTADTVRNGDGSSTTYRRDLSGLVWNWALAPAMPYGVLENLAVSGVIDFSKVGTGQIDMTAWRYYNSGDLCTLTWGLDVYAEANMGVAEVDIDFFDNQGFCAGLRSTGKSSYAGTFTESIVLNERGGGGKLGNTDAYGEEFPHAGNLDADGDVYFCGADSTCTRIKKEGKEYTGPHEDDCGTLYGNIVYLARVTVKYGARNALGDIDSGNMTRWRTFYRWLWTNGMFNEYYYNVDDFNVLKPNLQLDMSLSFDTRGRAGMPAMEIGRAYYRPDIDGLEWDEENVPQGWSTVGALVQHINQDGEADDVGNVLMTAKPTLVESFDTFNLNGACLDRVRVRVSMGPSEVVTDPETPSLNSTSGKAATSADDLVQPVRQTEFTLSERDDGTPWDYAGYAVKGYGSGSYVSDGLLGTLGLLPYGGNESPEMWGGATAYRSYLDSFSLNLTGGGLGDADLTYYDDGGNELTLINKKYVTREYRLNEVLTQDDGEYGDVPYKANRADVSLQYDDDDGLDYVVVTLERAPSVATTVTVSFTVGGKVYTADVLIDPDPDGDGDEGEGTNNVGRTRFTGKWDGEEPVSDVTLKPVSGDMDVRLGSVVDKWSAYGIRLCLAGTTFSKIYARSLERDNEAKVLRHIMRYNNGATDSADMLGLFYFGEDGYFPWHSGFMEFSHILTMGFGRHQNDSGYARAYIEQYRNVAGHIARRTDSDSMQSERTSLASHACEYDDKDNIQKNLVGWASGYPFCALVLAETAKGINNKWSTNYTYSDLPWHGWLNDCGYEYTKNKERIHYQESDIPMYTLEGWDIGDGSKKDEHNISVHGIMVYDYGKGVMTPVNDWMLGSYISDRTTLPPYNWQHVILAREDDSLGSLANMLGSLFSQLYVYDKSSEETFAKLSDITYPETYSEVWRKTIVVDMEYVGNGEEGANDPATVLDFLTVRTMDLHSYLDFMAVNSKIGGGEGYDGFCSANGIDLKNIDLGLEAAQRNVQFEFNMGYDCGDLRTDYVGMTETRNRLFPGYLNEDGTIPSAVATTTSVTANTLYCLTDAGNVTQFGSGISMRYARRFRLFDDKGNELDWETKRDADGNEYNELPFGTLYMERGDDVIDGQSFSGLANVIEYVEGYVRMNDLSQMTNSITTYKICWRNRHDDSKVADIEISGLPRASMFNHNTV